MDYKRRYDNIIDSAENRVLEGYSETHHIIPKCMGGSNAKENLVALTAREHLICHRLLVKMYPKSNSLRYAMWMMMNGFSSRNQTRNYFISSRLYEQTKLDFSTMVKARNHTDETKRKISESLTGRKRPPMTEEQKLKISKSKMGTPSWNKGLTGEQCGKGRKLGPKSQDTRDKISKSLMGKKQPEERKAKQAAALKLKWADPEFRQKMMDARNKKKELNNVK